MVLKLIIFISLIVLWLIVSPKFEAIGKFITKGFEDLFNDDEGEK